VRGQESMMVVPGGDADNLTRSDLRARGDAILASVRGGVNSGESEVPGNLTVATMAPGAKTALRINASRWAATSAVVPQGSQFWPQHPQPLCPPGMWWSGNTDGPQVQHAWLPVSALPYQSSEHIHENDAFSAWRDVPMKVDLDSLSSGFALTRPPGL